MSASLTADPRILVYVWSIGGASSQPAIIPLSVSNCSSESSLGRHTGQIQVFLEGLSSSVLYCMTKSVSTWYTLISLPSYGPPSPTPSYKQSQVTYLKQSKLTYSFRVVIWMICKLRNGEHFLLLIWLTDNLHSRVELPAHYHQVIRLCQGVDGGPSAKRAFSFTALQRLAFLTFFFKKYKFYIKQGQCSH